MIYYNLAWGLPIHAEFGDFDPVSKSHSCVRSIDIPSLGQTKIVEEQIEVSLSINWFKKEVK